MPVVDPASSEALPRIDGQHQAWPTRHRTSRLQGTVAPVEWWSWLGQLAHRAYQDEGWASGSHGWATVERVLRASHAAWDRAQTLEQPRVAVFETLEKPMGVWALPDAPWDGSVAHRTVAARVLRALRGFYGPRRNPFDPIEPAAPGTAQGQTDRFRHDPAAQARCLTLALDLLERTWPGWHDAWFTQQGFNAHPAFVAVQRHQPAVLQAWLRLGLTPDLRSDGRTLLQEAAWQGHEDLVGLLLDHGASPNARRWGERSAVQLALAHDQPSVFDRLRAQGARWPTHSFWINPATVDPARRHAVRWIARPLVLEAALWAQGWALQRWCADHPQAWAALDLPELAQRLQRLWAQDMKWGGNPGTGTGTVAFRLPPHAAGRLQRARDRSAGMIVDLTIRQQQEALQAVLQDPSVPAPPSRAARRL